MFFFIDRHLCNQHLSNSCAPFVVGGSELKSAEGATQGRPLSYVNVCN